MTELLESCFDSDLNPPAGSYTIAYYIGGEFAGSTSFEIAP